MNMQSASQSLRQRLNKGPTKLLGHRGARGEKLENSLAGFKHIQHLYQQNPDALVGIEFDVQLSKDGRLVVFHDDTLLRIYGHQSRLDQTNFSKLSQISNLSTNYGNHPLLTLDDMTPLLQHYLHIELEIKTHNRTSYKKLINALYKSLQQSNFAGLPITLTTFDTRLHYYLNKHSFLSKFKRGLLIEPIATNITSNITTNEVMERVEKSNYNDINLGELQLSTKQPLYKAPELAMQLGCSGVGLYYPLCTQELIDRCHTFNLSTTAWTVNDINDAHKLIDRGVDYIITDYPSTMLGN